MKKISSFAVGLLSLLVLCVLNLSAVGSIPLPIGSEDQLREYALPQVVRGYRDVTSMSLVRLDNQPTWVEVYGNGAEDVLDKLFGTEIVFGLSNPNDKVDGHVWLYDADGKALFYGSTSYTVEDLKDGPPSYRIWMQHIPLLGGVSNAKLLALNPDGVTTRTESIDVSNGRIMFQPYLAGVVNGIIAILFKDGTEAVYNLWQNGGNPVDSVPENSPEWQIEGHHVVSGGSSASVTVRFIETYNPPTILLKDVKQGQTVILDCLAMTYADGKGQYFERPTEVIITKSDGSMSTAPIFSDSMTSLKLQPGTYRLRFTWPTFQKSRTIWYGDSEPQG